MAVLFRVSADGTSLALEKGEPNVVNNLYEALLMHFVSDKVDIDAIIINILYENLLINVHSKIFTRDQSIANFTGHISEISPQKLHSCP